MWNRLSLFSDSRISHKDSCTTPGFIGDEGFLKPFSTLSLSRRVGPVAKSTPHRRFVEEKLRSTFYKPVGSFPNVRRTLIHNFRNISSLIAALNSIENGHHHRRPPPFHRTLSSASSSRRSFLFIFCFYPNFDAPHSTACVLLSKPDDTPVLSLPISMSAVRE